MSTTGLGRAAYNRKKILPPLYIWMSSTVDLSDAPGFGIDLRVGWILQAQAAHRGGSVVFS